MPEIRATGLSATVCDRWQQVSELLGGTTNTANMTAAVDLLYLLFCSSRWDDLQRKAATLITAQLQNRAPGPVIPVHPSEVKRVQIDGKKILAWTSSQGEPYQISRENWEKG